MTTHASSRIRCLAEDAVLLAIPIIAAFASSSFLWLLAGAGLAILAFNAITLHFPREVAIDDEGIRFRAYGREHAYAWTACRVKVRRFIVRDRILVRFEDRDGRRRSYWLLSRLAGFDALAEAVAARAER
jgi:hypothetical protein